MKIQERLLVAIHMFDAKIVSFRAKLVLKRTTLLGTVYAT